MAYDHLQIARIEKEANEMRARYLASGIRAIAARIASVFRGPRQTLNTRIS